MNRRRPESRHPFLRRAATLAAVLVLSILLTMWRHNASDYLTGNWDRYSQDLVFGRILQMQQGQSAPGGFLGSYTPEWGDNQNRSLFRDGAAPAATEFVSYTHQSGLQGTLLGIVNRGLLGLFPDGARRETMLYTVNSVLFYAAALCVCLAVWRAVGALPGAACLAAVLLAPWVQRGMKDLYWCLWTWLLPLLAALLVCRLRRRWCYTVVFAAVLARCLCGFEFISSLLILCELPLVYCFFACPEQRRDWFARMTGVGFSAVGGVAAALGVWLWQGWLYFGSWAQSADNIARTVSLRVTALETASLPESTVTVGEVLHLYFVQDATPLLQLGPFSLTVRGLLAVTGVLLAAALLLRWREVLPMAVVWGVSLLGPVSWMVLSKTHSAVHTHLMPMLWHFAFVPCTCILWAVLLQTVWKRRRRSCGTP